VGRCGDFAVPPLPPGNVNGPTTEPAILDIDILRIAASHGAPDFVFGSFSQDWSVIVLIALQLNFCAVSKARAAFHYWPSWALIIVSICFLTASRLKEAGSCIGGKSTAVRASLKTWL
jgi:hypothetical protein